MPDRSIPVIDLAPVLGCGAGVDDGATDDKIAADLLQAYGEVGFAYVVGHGISPDLIDSLFDASRRFHALPIADKLLVELNELHRGYIPIGTSTDTRSDLEVVTRPNQSASFMMMREAGPRDPDVLRGAYLAGPNRWPALAGFRDVLEAYDAAMSELAARLIGLFAIALDDGAGELVGGFDPPTTWLRLLHYPPRPPDAPADLYGSAPHRDFGAITILAQDDVGGLEVRGVDATWIDVPPRPGAFVMNTGQMMEIWSDGRLIATPHRVLNTAGVERFSCPYFYDPNVESIVKPLVSQGQVGESSIGPVHFGDRLRVELAAGYDRHART
jgi:isopenicillin N synthase-like dioxygenase